jgi:hypothetical protein
MMSIPTHNDRNHFRLVTFWSILHHTICAMSKQQEEVPGVPKQPEIIPPQEPDGPGWPSHSPEIIPQEEPVPELFPDEIPPPPTEGLLQLA